MTFCRKDSARVSTILSNLARKFAYDGLDHHTLLATRHDGRVRRKSVRRKRGSEEGGEVEAADARTGARVVQRSPARVRFTLRVLVSDNLSRTSFDSDSRRDGGQSTHSFENTPCVSNNEFAKLRPSPPPTHRPLLRSRLLHSSKI